MEKKIICPSCGGEFSEKLPKCPYCDSLNLKGAEQEYLEKLEDIREDLEELEKVPEKEAAAAIRSKGKMTVKVIVLALAAAAAIAGISWYLSGKQERKDEENLIWEQNHIPVFDELYENGEYEELIALYHDAVEGEHYLSGWEHNEFCWTYDAMLSVQKTLTEAEKTEPDKLTLTLLFCDEWTLIGSVYNEELNAEDMAFFAEAAALAQKDMRERFGLSDEEYDAFLQQAKQNGGQIFYDEAEKFVDEWYSLHKEGTKNKEKRER